ncbi:MAG: FAD-dependent oxidoreductase [Actinomycetota bacterium]|nr:FAD-dependent oxidoreductase [Actinomycetota bacterium]
MRQVVIIGGVAGGMSAATRLRRLDPTASIIVIERSGYVSYANCGLPYFVGGVIADRGDLLLQTPESLHARFRLDVRVLTEVAGIDRTAKSVKVRNLVDGISYELPYDYLIMSPGAQAIVPNLPGIERALTLRTIEDVTRLTQAVTSHPKNAVVIGGGFIGVETAENLVHRGIPTTLVEALDQVLAPLDPEMAMPVAEELIAHGITLRLGSVLSSIDEQGVVLADQSRINADLVILAIGVRPDTALAHAAGLEVGPRGGIVVDAFNRTSDLSIYAVGDAVEKTDALDGEAVLVPLANIANRQGRMVADHIMGRPVREVPTIGTAIVKVFDLAVATTGWSEKRLRAQGRPCVVLHSHPGSHAGYYPGSESMMLKMVVDPATGQILGAQGVGRAGVDKRIDVLATAMRAGITAPELADLELAYAPPFGSAKDPVNMLGYMADNVLSGLTQTLQWNELAAHMDRGAVLVDVRTPEEFQEGHIPEAINIPVDDLRGRCDQLPKQDVIVYCKVGQRGHTAANLLRECGVTAVNLDGGYETWSHSPAARN